MSGGVRSQEVKVPTYQVIQVSGRPWYTCSRMAHQPRLAILGTIDIYWYLLNFWILLFSVVTIVSLAWVTGLLSGCILPVFSCGGLRGCWHSWNHPWNKSLEAWKNVDTTTSHDNSNLERLTFMFWCSCILHLGISMLKLTPAPYSLHNTTTSGSQILQGCSICTCCIMWLHFIISLSISLRWSNRLLRYVRSKDMGFQLIHHQDLSVTWLTTDRNIPRPSKETKQSKVGDFDFQMGLSENSVPLHPMVNDHYPY